jgi:phosphinothricin acetyltransferase
MIRSATPSDAEAIIAIYNPYVASTAITFETVPVTADEMAGRIRNVLASYPWIVREEKGEILGYAYAGRWKDREAYRFSVETTVYVASEHARKGVGASLYQALIPELRRRGFHTALGVIALPNDASVALHERFGFVQVGRLPQVGWKLERWVDVGTWSLTL